MNTYDLAGPACRSVDVKTTTVIEGLVVCVCRICRTRFTVSLPQPAGPEFPPIPHDSILALIDSYLGSRRRAGQGYASRHADRNEDALARTRFGETRRIFCAGCADIVQDIDGVLANYLSMSFAAPHLFGERLQAFEADVRAELTARSPSGLFWDWPGDTEILLARRPR